MRRDIITLTDETGAPVRFELLDVIEHQSADYAVLLPADEDADSYILLRADADPANPDDYIFEGGVPQKTVDAVFAKFQKRHPELFEG